MNIEDTKLSNSWMRVCEKNGEKFIKSDDKFYLIVHIFNPNELDEANEAMENNSDISMITEDENGLIYLAENTSTKL